MTARVLMIQGTGSDVGKSLLVAGLARVFTRRGLKVRPFKPQNMSNNAAVTADGGEIGRAQALQARAARVAPSVDMNPVLLKPQSEIGAQVVVQGKVLGNARAREYQAMKPKLLGAVLESFERLAQDADLVLVEGAGGLLVRFDDDGGTLADVADLLDAPVIVVARAGLGTLNHTALTLEALRVRDIECLGVVIGSWPREPDLAARCNIDDIGPILGRIPEGAGDLTREAFLATVRANMEAYEHSRDRARAGAGARRGP
jgi:adenosylcobyric acid synthase